MKKKAERIKVIEKQKPLSLSILRRMQCSDNEEQGDNAREKKLQNVVTSNAYMAKAYAHVILRYLQDCERNAIDRAQSIHIVELGAGSGRFSYLLIKKLQALRLQSPVPTPAFCYIMTDFTQKNIDFWRAHPALQPFIKEGLLDFALFDAENDSRLLLQESGIALAPESIQNPVIALANALFGSLIQDVFRVQSGNIEQGLVPLYHTEPTPPDPQKPLNPDQINARYDFEPVPNGYYRDPEFDKILHTYNSHLSNCAFCFPIGALRCIRNLLHLSHNRLFLLSADTGNTLEQDLLKEMPPIAVTHDDCFSTPVNCHAIAQFFQNKKNGRFLHMATRSGNLCISGFVYGETTHSYPATKDAFSEHIENFEPDDFNNICTAVHAWKKKTPLLTLLSMIRLSEYDTQVFYELSDAILDVLDYISYEHETELFQVLERVYDNWYYTQSSLIEADQIATIYYNRHFYAKSLIIDTDIIKHHGERAGSLFRIGLCLYKMNKIHQALSFFKRSLAIDNTNETTRLWRIRLENLIELSGDNSTLSRFCT